MDAVVEHFPLASRYCRNVKHFALNIPGTGSRKRFGYGNFVEVVAEIYKFKGSYVLACVSARIRACNAVGRILDLIFKNVGKFKRNPSYNRFAACAFVSEGRCIVPLNVA